MSGAGAIAARAGGSLPNCGRESCQAAAAAGAEGGERGETGSDGTAPATDGDGAQPPSPRGAADQDAATARQTGVRTEAERRRTLRDPESQGPSCCICIETVRYFRGRK